MLQRNFLSTAVCGAVLCMASLAAIAAGPSAEAVSAMPTSSGEKSAVEKLYIEHKCYECHRPAEHHIGPSWEAISLRYAASTEDRADLLKRLSDKVINGGYGNWGITPMNSNPNVQPDEATELVEWVLTQP